MYLLDTVTVSELRKGPERANPGLVDWNAQVTADQTCISVVTIRELRTGALLVERRDPDGGQHLHRWIEGVVVAYSPRILPIDITIAQTCAALHVPDPMSSEDAWIAATALTHGLTVVTRNTDDFDGNAVKVLNPWA